MSQLQVTGEAKIRDIQGPVVANSGVVTALDGAASQYVRGDGTLADFPTSTGGGSSVSYYLNSSVSQGTIGGVAYRQLGKTPISGAGTDIAISTTGYIASYITDANDPALLEVPAGNFNCEFYFSVNNNTGNPFVYAEVYKYDGTTFTLIGTSVGVPEYINQGTVINPYYFAVPVSQSVLTITDRIAIRIYVNVDGRTVTLHTENNHLCQVVTTFSKGLTSLNNLTRQVQFLGTGTSGTDFNISSVTATHTFNLPVASASNTGKLSSTDWSTFNNKIAGTGTTNYLSKFTSASAIGNSLVYDNGTNVIIANGTTDIQGRLQVTTSGGALLLNTDNSNFAILFRNTASTNKLWDISSFNNDLVFNEGGVGSRLYLKAGGDVGIGNTTPAYKLDVSGTGRFTGELRLESTITNGTFTYTLPAATGTLALTSELGAYLPLAGGTLTGALSGTSSTFSSSVTANSLIKTGGTSAQILAADGSVITAGTNITISGGTISSSGAITGSGTTNYVTKFTGASSIGNSLIFDNGTNIGIGLTSPSYKLDVQDNGVSGIVDVSSFSVTGNGGSGRGVGILLGAAGSSNSVQVARLVGYQELANPVAVAASFAIQVANSSGTLTERLRITQAGNLLIGSTSDNGSRLQVNGTTSNDLLYLDAGINTDYAFKIVAAANDVLTLRRQHATVGALDIISFGFNGNVGIGTTTPQGALEVVGLSYFTRSSQSTLFNPNYGGANTHAQLQVIGNMALAFATNGDNERMRITSTGNVGIGTSSPNGRLDIREANRVFDAYGNVNVFTTDSGSQNVGGSIALGGDSFGGTTPYPFAKIQGIKEGGGAWSGALILGTTQSNSAITEKMRITSTGSVGISTTSPIGGVFKLQVGDGSADTRAIIVSNSVYQIGFRNGAGNPVFYEGSDTSGNKIFSNNAGGELMRITSLGKLLVGTTTSTGSSVLANRIIEFAGNMYSKGSESGYFWTDRSNDANFYGWYALSGAVYLYNGSSNIAVIAGSNGLYTAISDINKKKDFEDSTIGLNAIMGLKPTLFRMKEEDESVEKSLGFIAQQVKEFIPQAYVEGEDFIGLSDRPIIAALVKAIQEQQAQIEELKELIKNK